MQNNALLAGIPQVISKSDRYSVLIILFLFLLNPLLAQERTQPIINATISGTVIDSFTKEPLEGALVQPSLPGRD